MRVFTEPPRNDELELSVFRGGCGDGLVLHMGDGEWLVNSVVLWIETGETFLLLGADMERKWWLTIVGDRDLSAGRASVLNVPHLGSTDAHEPTVWDQMLCKKPYAVSTTWRRDGRELPTAQDAQRLLDATPNAWVTRRGSSTNTPSQSAHPLVAQVLRESGMTVPPGRELGLVRLRRRIGLDEDWRVERFGDACHLGEYRVGG